MRSKIMAPIVAAFLFLSPTLAHAQSPEAILKMCLRDGRNAISRLNKDIHRGARSFYSFESICIKGPRAAKISGLSEYPQVMEFYRQAKAKLTSVVSQQEKAKAVAKSAALEAGPGGDFNTVRARWKARPARCQTVEAWSKAAGISPRKKGSSRISGLEDLSPAKKVHPRLFDGRSAAGRWPEDFTPDDHLARIVCGDCVEGIDSYFSERSHIYGTQLLPGDSRISLAEAVLNHWGDDAHDVLYKVALIQECFRATQWNVKKDYAQYAHCRDAVGQPPTRSQVKAAAEAVFPGRKFERDNLLYLLREGVKSMAEVDAVFARVEAKYPRMKAVFRDSARQGRARYALRRSRHAAAYRILDPITARLRQSMDSPPPAGCEKALLGLREKLIRQVKPRSPEGVRQLRVVNPLGYQISEALAYCYMGSGKLARAFMEIRALQKGNRRVNLSEEIFFSRLDALVKVARELKATGRIQQVLPNYDGFWSGLPRPESVYTPRLLLSKLKSMGSYRIFGEKKQAPAVVTAISPVSKGVKLTFKKNRFVYKYRRTTCRDTNKVDRYELSGSSIRPIYRQSCHEVGPLLTRVVVHQESPVVVPREDASAIKKGMQVVGLNNVQAEGDAVITDRWWPKQGRKKALLIQGIKVR